MGRTCALHVVNLSLIPSTPYDSQNSFRSDTWSKIHDTWSLTGVDQNKPNKKDYFQIEILSMLSYLGKGKKLILVLIKEDVD